MNILELDYTCFSYNDYNFLLVKIPENILTDIATPQEYSSTHGDFIFNFTENLQITNEKNSFLISFNSQKDMKISNVTQSITLDWINNKRFIFKFVREKSNINSLDNDTLKIPSNIINVMQVN